MTIHRLALTALAACLLMTGATAAATIDLSSVPHAGVRLDVFPSRGYAQLILAGHAFANLRATLVAPDVFRLDTPGGRTLTIDLPRRTLSCADGRTGRVARVDAVRAGACLKVTLQGATHPLSFGIRDDGLAFMYVLGNKILDLKTTPRDARGLLTLSTGQGLFALHCRPDPLALWFVGRDGAATYWVSRPLVVDPAALRRALPTRWQAIAPKPLVKLELNGWRGNSGWSRGIFWLGGYKIGALTYRGHAGGAHIRSRDGGSLWWNPQRGLVHSADLRGLKIGAALASCSAQETRDGRLVLTLRGANLELMVPRDGSRGRLSLRGQTMVAFDIGALAGTTLRLDTRPETLFFEGDADRMILYVKVPMGGGRDRKQVLAWLNPRR